MSTNCISEVFLELASKESDFGGEKANLIIFHQAGLGSEDWPHLLALLSYGTADCYLIQATILNELRVLQASRCLGLSALIKRCCLGHPVCSW